MAESLNVIALISGGKDSFFSILHCLQSGHKVVALGNLYPQSPAPKPGNDEVGSDQELEKANEEDEHDLNSFMYQTVGHTVIPLYEEALGIPLYRQPIVGSAVQNGTSYSHHAIAGGALGQPAGGEVKDVEDLDETESLVPLLRRIMREHPSANALSTGAILSTYQRTRIESVATRLGLTALSYLWKYPILPPGTQASLLQDMQAVGLDARIVKVASGGLDETFLWENVASGGVTRRVERSMKRFGTDGDGAVLGEGGEFETLVIDGPSHLFRGRITVHEKDQRVVREGGGSAWLQIKKATVLSKTTEPTGKLLCRIPELLDSSFKALITLLSEDRKTEQRLTSLDDSPILSFPSPVPSPVPSLQSLSIEAIPYDISYWTISCAQTSASSTISDEAEGLVEEIKEKLANLSLQPNNIISTLIILRSMQDFAVINNIYGSLFTQPNPPTRVTIACGSTMPKNTNITIHLKLQLQPQTTPLPRRALHVQSRSFWAPANIGPYSQAISVPQSTRSSTWTISIAGQIALVPATMVFPTPIASDFVEADFNLQTVLALQHLWRIGREMHTSWWTSAVTYLPRAPVEKVQRMAVNAGRAWALAHVRNDEDEDEDVGEVRDLWEEKFYAGMQRRGAEKEELALPDWDTVRCDRPMRLECPPFWAAEVEELPRGAAVEWHAHLGVVGSAVTVDMWGAEDSWTVHQCIVGERKFLVVMIIYIEEPSQFEERLREALSPCGSQPKMLQDVYLSYLDHGITVTKDVQKFTGTVPCRTVWDITGRRLSAVLLIDLPSFTL